MRHVWQLSIPIQQLDLAVDLSARSQIQTDFWLWETSCILRGTLQRSKLDAQYAYIQIWTYPRTLDSKNSPNRSKYDTSFPSKYIWKGWLARTSYWRFSARLVFRLTLPSHEMWLDANGCLDLGYDNFWSAHRSYAHQPCENIQVCTSFTAASYWYGHAESFCLDSDRIVRNFVASIYGRVKWAQCDEG